MDKDERDKIITSKLAEIMGIVSEGLGSQYGVYITTQANIKIKEKPPEKDK